MSVYLSKQIAYIGHKAKFPYIFFGTSFPMSSISSNLVGSILKISSLRANRMLARGKLNKSCCIIVKGSNQLTNTNFNLKQCNFQPCQTWIGVYSCSTTTNFVRLYEQRLWYGHCLIVFIGLF